MKTKLEVVNTSLMSPPELFAWLQIQAAQATDICGEAESYWRRMREHNDNMQSLAGMMKELVDSPDHEDREEIDDVATAIGEILLAMRALREQSMHVSEYSKTIDQIESGLAASDEGKAAAEEIRYEAAEFLKKYNRIKSRLKLLTQQDVADRTGLDRRQISRIESGEFKPQFKTVQKLADGFGVEVSELL